MSIRLAAALGNAEERYRGTRHNAGFAVASELVASLDEAWRRSTRYLWSELSCRGDRLVVICPRTYMNLSGTAVQAAAAKWDAEPAEILVIHDDMDLPLGRLRISSEAGSGGHRGVSSVAEALGTLSFPRLRIGIGRPDTGQPARDYVLSRFSLCEVNVAEEVFAVGSRAVVVAWRCGLQQAMNDFNGYDITESA